MSQYLEIDPKTRDYIVTRGVPVRSDRIEESVYFALLIQKDRWLYGQPDQGSLIYTLQNQMHTASTEQQFATYAEDAINRQLVQKGKASAVVAGNAVVTSTQSLNKVEVVADRLELSTKLNFVSV